MAFSKANILKKIKEARKKLLEVLETIQQQEEEFEIIEDYQTIVIGTKVLLKASDDEFIESFDEEKLKNILIPLLAQSKELKVLHEELVKLKKESVQ